MKINEKIFSIPPYISTAWSNISTIRIKDNQLLITLIDGNTVQIPSLPTETTEMISKNHADYLENQSKGHLMNPYPSYRKKIESK